MKKRKKLSLRALRLNAGLTLYGLSEKTGIPFSTIQVLENGQGKKFDIRVKCELANFFKTPLLDLFPEERERAELVLGAVRPVQAQEKPKD